MKKGFTLIELLAVVLIMGILAAVAMPQYTRSLNRARIAEAEQMLAPIYEARERARIESEANGDSAVITADMLDIGIKSATTIRGSFIITPNYTYNIGFARYVVATLQKGRDVKGTRFVYDGKKMYCCNPKSSKDVCNTVFNFTRSDSFVCKESL